MDRYHDENLYLRGLYNLMGGSFSRASSDQKRKETLLRDTLQTRYPDLAKEMEYVQSARLRAQEEGRNIGRGLTNKTKAIVNDPRFIQVREEVFGKGKDAIYDPLLLTYREMSDQFSLRDYVFGVPPEGP